MESSQQERGLRAVPNSDSKMSVKGSWRPLTWMLPSGRPCPGTFPLETGTKFATCAEGKRSYSLRQKRLRWIKRHARTANKLHPQKGRETTACVRRTKTETQEQPRIFTCRKEEKLQLASDELKLSLPHRPAQPQQALLQCLNWSCLLKAQVYSHSWPTYATDETITCSLKARSTLSFHAWFDHEWDQKWPTCVTALLCPVLVPPV